MKTPPTSLSSSLASGNLEYLEVLYSQYLQDPKQMEPAWRWFFKGMDFASLSGLSESSASLKKELGIFQLVNAYREDGFLRADLDPLNMQQKELLPDLKSFHLTGEDLNKSFASLKHLFGTNRTLSSALSFLKKTYCGSLALQVGGCPPEVRGWFFNEFEKPEFQLSKEQKREVFSQLACTQYLENFLHFRFMGKKRFSIEGLDVLIPMMEYLLQKSTQIEMKEMAIGMAHRGRVSLLAQFLKQDMQLILSRFEEGLESNLFEGEDFTGDVKYHFGFSNERESSNGRVRIHLGYNPSHLEAINPVVLGFARALQRKWKDTKRRKTVLPILIHGDAAFCGQGSVSETLQLSRLKGYTVGGTLHIILNNQLGFTTGPEEGRSTLFPSDLAKSIQAPVLLVNADDVEASLKAIDMALRFRHHFGQDVFIDLIGYRRHGHNEGDEPAFTQGPLYAKIKEHPTVLEKYKEQLLQEKILSPEAAEHVKTAYEKNLEETLEQIRSKASAIGKQDFTGLDSLEKNVPPLKRTGTTKKNLQFVLDSLCKEPPKTFHLHPKIKRLLKKRRELVQKDQLDWSLCEMAAYGTLLKDSYSIRLTGQDTKRGTFSHRQAVYFDEKSGESFSPLKKFIASKNQECCIYNSPLSEMAVLGFEYGNSCMAGDFLTVWEAQFGDFVNGAQIIIDQFIAAGESKWLQNTDIVLFLPHGYEGQGPEHSSGNLERFLQLCAQKNLRVLNLTSPANLFHALRRQKRDPRKPLIIMTPKSLLRHPQVVTSSEALCEGEFQEVLWEKGELKPSKTVQNIIFCSGKVYYDFKNHPEVLKAKDTLKQTALFRVEQFYPFPKTSLNGILNGFPCLERILWLQEEPKNRGAWMFMEPRLRKLLSDIGLSTLSVEYVGRAKMAAPAEGSLAVHKQEQDRLIRQALSKIC